LAETAAVAPFKASTSVGIGGVGGGETGDGERAPPPNVAIPNVRVWQISLTTSLNAI
jgi:hypothetical protein